MSSLSELQRIDRELSSELIESPINPAFLHMSSPLKSEYDPFFDLQINGEALWQWRKLNADPKKGSENFPMDYVDLCLPVFLSC